MVTIGTLEERLKSLGLTQDDVIAATMADPNWRQLSVQQQIHEMAIADIRRRHAAMKDALHRDNCTEFVPQESVRPEQLGLHPVMVDEKGRLWRTDCNPLIMVFDPERPPEPVRGRRLGAIIARKKD